MEMEKNLSCVLHSVNDLRMEEREIPVPKDNQLLIRVHTVGICGSDVHFWTHGAIGQFVVREPLVLGHESCGTVIGWGSKVTEFKKGDRVAMEPGLCCRECEFCKRGRYNLCEKSTFYGTPPTHGSLCRYVVHDADFCFKLPDHVTWEEGAFLEPLSVAVYACRRAQLAVGQKVLILGAGPIGLITLLAAKAAGASKVFMTDLMDSRLQKAQELGVDGILNVKDMKPEEIAAKITDFFGCEPEVSFECTGATPCMETGILATKRGGVMVLVGLGAQRDDLPIITAAIKEIDLRGILRYANCYGTALDLVASGLVKLDALSRASYKLQEAPEAFQRFLKADVIKVFIQCADD